MDARAKRADRIVEVMLGIDPMADLPRTGWLLRGVRPCESIADHSFGVAFVTMLLVDALREDGETVDGERALRMALVHDAPEARTGDVPMPQKTASVSAALHELEALLTATLLPAPQRETWTAMERGESLEARIVKAADKIQMMIKALIYARQQRGDLAEFWAHPKNFDDRGVVIAREVFAAIAARAGREVPR
jgi:putative hydrolase of HD superfamily